MTGERSIACGWLLLLVTPLANAAESDAYVQLGAPASAAEIAAANTDLAPTGQAPAGQGNAAGGEGLYQQHCAHCHGPDGQGGLHEPLVLPAQARIVKPMPFGLDPRRRRVIGNYWPYATTLYDYIRRAMPQHSPGSLSNDEAYALTAYLLYLNGLVERDTVVDGEFLQRLELPARASFEFSDESKRFLR